MVQKRFVCGSATRVAYLGDKAPNMAVRSDRQRCAGVIDYTSGLTLLLDGSPSLTQPKATLLMSHQGHVTAKSAHRRWLHTMVQ